MHTLQLEKTSPNGMYQNLTDFNKENILIPDFFYKHNLLVKGSTRTGKTEKVMLPIFLNTQVNTNERKLFITTSYNYIELQDYNCILYDICKAFNNDRMLQTIIDDIENGENVIIYLDTLLVNKKDYIEKLNNFLYNISNKYKLILFFDEFQYLAKLNFIIDYFNKPNYYFYFSVQYSSQLKDCGYSLEEINKFKDNSFALDTEKQ